MAVEITRVCRDERERAATKAWTGSKLTHHQLHLFTRAREREHRLGAERERKSTSRGRKRERADATTYVSTDNNARLCVWAYVMHSLSESSLFLSGAFLFRRWYCSHARLPSILIYVCTYIRIVRARRARLAYRWVNDPAISSPAESCSLSARGEEGKDWKFEARIGGRGLFNYEVRWELRVGVWRCTLDESCQSSVNFNFG